MRFLFVALDAGGEPQLVLQSTNFRHAGLIHVHLQGRKDYIAENGYKYMDMIDVS